MLRAAFTVAGAVSGLPGSHQTHRLPIDSDPGTLFAESNYPSDTSGAQVTATGTTSQGATPFSSRLDFLQLRQGMDLDDLFGFACDGFGLTGLMMWMKPPLV